MGDVSSSNFSRAAPGPGWLVANNYMALVVKLSEHLINKPRRIGFQMQVRAWSFFS